MTALPIIICDFWRNRRGEAVRIQIREYEGQTLIDCRVHFTNKDGKLTPTSKFTGLRKALAKAAALGLLRENTNSSPEAIAASERQPLLDALDEAEQ